MNDERRIDIRKPLLEVLGQLLTTNSTVGVDDGPGGDVAYRTTLAYDPRTFRLAVGNIVEIADGAQKTLYVSNEAVSANQNYAYDALYRLTSATGREKSGRGWADWTEPDYDALPSSGEAGRRYEESYAYDEAGNLLELAHAVPMDTGSSWTRTLTVESGSNRLVSTTESVGTVSYRYDARGNAVFLPHLYNDGGTPTPTDNVEPDFRDQMRRAQLNASDVAVYHYDAAGQRVRKVVKKGATVEERIYVDGYEVWRKRTSGSLQEERQTVQVADGESRVAMIETKTWSGGAAVSSPAPVVRVQLGNHLGTAILELTETGELISYEEYHPYGSTAWWAGSSALISQKRYRYTGMERDEETGLQCHGVRYYAPWLGRWTSADPMGLGDGVNRFAYCHGGPVGGRDASGLWQLPTVAEIENLIPTAAEVGEALEAGGAAAEAAAGSDAMAPDPTNLTPAKWIGLAALGAAGLGLTAAGAYLVSRHEGDASSGAPAPAPKPQPASTTTTTSPDADPKSEDEEKRRVSCRFVPEPVHAGLSQIHDDIAQQYQAPGLTGDTIVVAQVDGVDLVASYDAMAADGTLTEVKTLRYGGYSPDLKEFALTTTLLQISDQATVADLCGKPYQVVSTSEWLSMDISDSTAGAVRVVPDTRPDYDYFDFSIPPEEDDSLYYDDLIELAP